MFVFVDLPVLDHTVTVNWSSTVTVADGPKDEWDHFFLLFSPDTKLLQLVCFCSESKYLRIINISRANAVQSFLQLH